jgi:hypothetical protein
LLDLPPRYKKHNKKKGLKQARNDNFSILIFGLRQIFFILLGIVGMK